MAIILCYIVLHMSPVKQICVFEHSVMTSFNCACPLIQRGQGSGFLSEGSSWLTACMSEQQRFWRDCADAQARLNLRCSHMRWVPNSLDAVHIFKGCLIILANSCWNTFSIPADCKSENVWCLRFNIVQLLYNVHMITNINLQITVFWQINVMFAFLHHTIAIHIITNINLQITVSWQII